MRARACAVAVLWAAALAACDDMTHEKKVNPYRAQAVGPGQVPAATVAFGQKPAAPPPLTLALIERGQERFRVFCTPCHSELGDGHGMVVKRGFSPPPTYHQARLREAPTSHFYDVMTNGWGAMYSFAQRIPPDDRWAIASYIRALQRSQDATLADLSPEQRASLEQGPVPPSPSPVELVPPPRPAPTGAASHTEPPLPANPAPRADASP